MSLLNVIFGILSVSCLVFSGYMYLFLYSRYKKYEEAVERVLMLKNEKISENFARESLISRGFPDYVVEDMMNEYYS